MTKIRIRNRNTFIYDLLLSLSLFLISYYIVFLKEGLKNIGLNITNLINSDLVQYTFFTMSVIYLTITFFFIKWQQKPIIKLVKLLVILFGFFLISICTLFTIEYNEISKESVYLVTISIIIATFMLKSTLLVINSGITCNQKTFKINGDYGQTIPFETISNINLQYSFPKISYRIRGVDFLNIKKGRFRLLNGDKCFIYTYGNSLPILKIEMKNGVFVLLSCKTSRHTLDIYKVFIKNIETQ